MAALEKELVRALQALQLQEIPEEVIKAVFDTGGTTLRRHGAEEDDFLDAASLDALESLDRVFGKYLDQLSAARTRSDGRDEEGVTGSPLWTFLTGNTANAMIMGDESSRAHHYTSYRALFAMLNSLINISEGYAALNISDKVKGLVKALIASKIFLNWLQLPGGAAYGLFMPFVYRQVLDVMRKWVDAVSSPDALTTTMSGGSSQRDRTPRKKAPRGRGTQRSSQGDDNDDGAIDTTTHKRLVKAGVEVLDTIVKFLQNFAMSSSKESIIPTIEMAVHVQIVGSNSENGSVSSASARSQHILEGLLNEIHGDIMQTARVIVHCYIPGACFQETTADPRSATKFQKFATDMINFVQTTVARQMRVSAEDTIDDSADQLSTLNLGILQNVCLNAPDRSEERQRVLAFAFQMCTAPELLDHDRRRFVRFLTSFSKNMRAKNRQFAVELAGKLILEPSMWVARANEVSDSEMLFCASTLLSVLTERSRDKVSSVRAKAIGAISAVLSVGLQVDDVEEIKVFQNNTTSNNIAAALHAILYASSDDNEGTGLMPRLIELFREGLQDEKTFVRKAAIQALEALIVVRPSSIDRVMRRDLFDIQSRCTDKSLLVRIQAAKSLSAVMMKFPSDDEVQKLWNVGVLPLCVDVEASVQAAALEQVNRVVFDRVSMWYRHRKSNDEDISLSSVWDLVSNLDGVMVRCAQKALRLLLKEGKADATTIINASIYAIKTCLNQLNEAGETQPQYWSFSWIVLEEMAHTGRLVEAAKTEQHNWSIVVDCWNKLQEETLPTAFAEGSKRILRVIASLAPIIDAQDAKEIADSILASLHSFSIPLNVISEAVLALHSICMSKAPSPEKGREISFAWGKQLLAACEANLRACFEGEPNLLIDETTLIQKQLICVGEVALLEFTKDDEKTREAGIALIPIASIKPLVQLFLPPEIAPSRVPQSSQATSTDEPTTPTKDADMPVAIPIPIRVCAFLTLGKLCLRDQDLAKSCITMFIRELRTCDNQDIRSNILLILGDLCIRYTALVDVYISTIALSFLDKSPLIRRNALLLFSQLILQDYVKWRESLLRFFLRAVVDEDEELSNLARHVLCGPLIQKAPHLFTNKFIEMIFVFNKFEGKVNFSEPFEREGIEEIALPGSSRFSKRFQLYKFLLQNMSDEQRLQISMKLCTEVLEEVSDGKLKLCDNPSEITDFGTEAILKDTFAILCSSDIKLSSSREDIDAEDADVEEGTVEGGEASTTVATQLAAAKGKLLSKMSKKNFLENVVPVLIGLKHKLESKRSPLMRYLLHYIRELFKLYGQEVRDILSADPQMAMEVEYDLRQYELQQQKQQQESHNGRLSIGGGTTTPTKNRRSSTGNAPRTPLQILESGQTPQLLSPSAHSRRRQSMPAAGTPSHPIQQRQVSSEEKATEAPAGSTMLFSPGKDSQRGKWHVTAKSPVVASRKPGKRFTQKELEESMQRDLATAFDSASSPAPDDLPPTTLTFDDVDEDEEVVKLPLKKKTKKISRKQETGRDDEGDKDPLELKTPEVRRSKRKRN